jgi:hypothetical protein
MSDFVENENLAEQERPNINVDAAVREHSYLRGTANPLFPAALVEQRRRQEQDGSRSKDSWSSGVYELPILELEGVVLMPGSTLPLRLRDASWVEYLGQKIDDCRGHPNQEVRIGVLTQIRAVDRRRSSTLRMAFTAGNPLNQQGLMLVLLNVDDDNNDDDGEEFNEHEEEDDDNVSAEYHELMDEGDDSDDAGDDSQTEHHDQAIVREAGHDPMEDNDGEVHQEPIGFDQREEENKCSEEEKAEQGAQDSQQSHQEDSASPHTAPASQLRYNVDLVEENLGRIDRSLNDAQEVLDGIQGEQIDHRHLLNISSRLDRAEEAQRPIVEAFDAILDMIRGGAQLSDPMFSDLLRTGRRHRVRVSQQLDRMQSIHFRLRHLNEQADSVRSGDPLIGRIGTVATVSYTYDETSDALDVGGSESSRNEERDELVVAVLGTNRFRIVSRVGEDHDNGALDQHRMLFGNRITHEVRLYKVEELPDKEPALPPTFIRAQRPIRLLEEADQRFLYHQKQIIHNLSNVSSIPQIALKAVWPWRLVGLIRTALDRNPIFDGLTKILSNLNENSPVLEPTSFSFWMACNMSLSQEEKLRLLKMPSTVERLSFILQRVVEQEENETYVCCKSCSARLSSASEMFTVGGAEGTTGNYVNEYGVVHQTITVREADEPKLSYSGGPETRDSWFPGYSWTITYCQRCHSHLGWKFDLVQKSTATEDRPEVFFGWSASSVTSLPS